MTIERTRDRRNVSVNRIGLRPPMDRHFLLKQIGDRSRPYQRAHRTTIIRLVRRCPSTVSE